MVVDSSMLQHLRGTIHCRLAVLTEQSKIHINPGARFEAPAAHLRALGTQLRAPIAYLGALGAHLGAPGVHFGTFVFKFKHPCTIVLSRPSGSGKSVLTKMILCQGTIQPPP